jgi:hypothetical protein
MPTDPTEALPPRLSEVRSVQSFLANIIDTMQNWRDSLQSELPGFRDRICQIRMSKSEGGLSLTMPPAVVQRLIDLGGEGGQTILSIFDERRWHEHQWIRYLTMMSQLQGNLHKAGTPFGTFRLGLANGLPDVPFSVYRLGRGFGWCQDAEAATTDLLALARAWGPAPLGVDFCGPDLPIPVPVMRVVPIA